MLCAKFGWNLTSGSREEDKKLKVYGQTDRQRTTGDQKSSRAFSSGELKTCHEYNAKFK